MCALIRRLGEEDITGCCGHMYDHLYHFEIAHEHNTIIVYCKIGSVKFSLVTCMYCLFQRVIIQLFCHVLTCPLY